MVLRDVSALTHGGWLCAGGACCRAMMEELGSHTDKLHILVNNAGTTWGEPLEKYQDKGTALWVVVPRGWSSHCI